MPPGKAAKSQRASCSCVVSFFCLLVVLLQLVAIGLPDHWRPFRIRCQDTVQRGSERQVLLHRDTDAHPQTATQRQAATQQATASAAASQPQDTALSQIAQTEPTQPQDRIPSILHQVFLSGEAAWEAEVSKAHPIFRRQWRDGCRAAYPGWRYKLWDRAAAEKLLADNYPWFLDTFRSYPRIVMQGDAIRPFIMHAEGGLYLDMDVECYREGASMLQGYDLVLQNELHAPKKTITNGVVASGPGHPFWEAVFEKLVHRVNSSSGSVVFKTGPRPIHDTLLEQIGSPDEAGRLDLPHDKYVGEHVLNNGRTLVRVYDVGRWFTPCQFNDEKCYKSLARMRMDGTTPLSLVGHHRYTGTWKPCAGECHLTKKHRKKGEQTPMQ